MKVYIVVEVYNPDYETYDVFINSAYYNKESANKAAAKLQAEVDAPISPHKTRRSSSYTTYYVEEAELE